MAGLRDLLFGEPAPARDPAMDGPPPYRPWPLGEPARRWAVDNVDPQPVADLARRVGGAVNNSAHGATQSWLEMLLGAPSGASGATGDWNPPVQATWDDLAPQRRPWASRPEDPIVGMTEWGAPIHEMGLTGTKYSLDFEVPENRSYTREFAGAVGDWWDRGGHAPSFDQIGDFVLGMPSAMVHGVAEHGQNLASGMPSPLAVVAQSSATSTPVGMLARRGAFNPTVSPDISDAIAETLDSFPGDERGSIPVPGKVRPEDIRQGSWYSPSELAAANLSQPRGNYAQMRAQLLKGGGKEQELLWSGMDNAFLPHQKVTRGELQDYLRMHAVRPDSRERYTDKHNDFVKGHSDFYEYESAQRDTLINTQYEQEVDFYRQEYMPDRIADEGRSISDLAPDDLDEIQEAMDQLGHYDAHDPEDVKAFFKENPNAIEMEGEWFDSEDAYMETEALNIHDMAQESAHEYVQGLSPEEVFDAFGQSYDDVAMAFENQPQHYSNWTTALAPDNYTETALGFPAYDAEYPIPEHAALRDRVMRSHDEESHFLGSRENGGVDDGDFAHLLHYRTGTANIPGNGKLFTLGEVQSDIEKASRRHGRTTPAQENALVRQDAGTNAEADEAASRAWLAENRRSMTLPLPKTPEEVAALRSYPEDRLTRDMAAKDAKLLADVPEGAQAALPWLHNRQQYAMLGLRSALSDAAYNNSVTAFGLPHGAHTKAYTGGSLEGQESFYGTATNPGTLGKAMEQEMRRLGAADPSATDVLMTPRSVETAGRYWDLTPEMKERIKREGMPLWSFGGDVGIGAVLGLLGSQTEEGQFQ